MKNYEKILTIILITLISIITYGQDYTQYSHNEDTYHNSYTNRDFNISIQDSVLYIDMFSIDNISKVGGVMFSNDQLSDFTDSLTKVKLKCEEIRNTTKENRLTKLNITSQSGGYYLIENKWIYQNDITLSFYLKIKDNIYYLIVSTGELNNHDGFLIVFLDNTEVDEFIKIINKKL